MICEDARLLIGADPECAAPELEEHLRGCAECAALREEMRRFNADIRRALQEPPDLQLPRHVPAAPRWREWALAASVVLASLAAIAVWLLRPTDTLAHEVVMHVRGEPDSWLSTHNVNVGAIDHSLRRSGVALDFASDRIVYAQSCWFRGHYVPHLVVETAQGPATVLILRHVQVKAPDYFHESGMSGVIVPAGDGSIAVLERGSAQVKDLAGELRQEVHWLPEPKDPS
ncbi:MAG TPA: DUF3379 family protein [Steroidobacteraceae bacterium]|nr:DUF3379 family protein [Steroidobacteraceae bacterium]